ASFVALYFQASNAGVADLADALDSKSSDRKIVWVRAPPPANRLNLSLTRENLSGIARADFASAQRQTTAAGRIHGLCLYRGERTTMFSRGRAGWRPGWRRTGRV